MYDSDPEFGWGRAASEESSARRSGGGGKRRRLLFGVGGGGGGGMHIGMHVVFRIWAVVGIAVGKIGNGCHIRFYMVRNHIKSNLHEKSNMCLARQNFCIKSILHGDDFM